MVKKAILKIHFMTESKYREQSDGGVPSSLYLYYGR